LNRAVQAVLMDASALLAPFQLGIDFERWINMLVDAKVRFYVLEDTLRELRSLSTSSGKIASEAKEALRLAERYEAVPGASERRGDEGLIEAAMKHGYAVATCDRSLRARLRDLKVPVFSPTGRRRARVEGLSRSRC
jgi:rRNA-processing protein FCF1